jgi:hypothetical protein
MAMVAVPRSLVGTGRTPEEFNVLDVLLKMFSTLVLYTRESNSFTLSHRYVVPIDRRWWDWVVSSEAAARTATAVDVPRLRLTCHR